MSKIENLTAELCDQLMQTASSGDLECIKTTVLMLIEYSACEVSRRSDARAAALLRHLGREFEIIFPTSV